METTENIKTLKDYREIFEKFFNGNDIERIAKKTNLSERTIKNYMSGLIPDSIAGRANEGAILDECLIIINEKKEFLSI